MLKSWISVNYLTILLENMNLNKSIKTLVLLLMGIKIVWFEKLKVKLGYLWNSFQNEHVSLPKKCGGFRLNSFEDDPCRDLDFHTQHSHYDGVFHFSLFWSKRAVENFQTVRPWLKIESNNTPRFSLWQRNMYI